MKRTVLDGKQWILDLLLRAKVNEFINGQIYKDNRPVNSNKEDIVINSLTMTNQMLQNGVFNINCYVPKKSVTVGGITQLHKDNKRLKEIADKVYAVLNDVWENDYNLDVETHQDFEEQNENYYNFRVQLNAYPTFN
ncbi:hypothetical protein RIU07_05630 [Riemerella anatipestifer]|uniref:hypothetical protein n=1 Tax=Riemerella anatipestifer TaxID=34085 RepID=UPI001C1E16E3|nr:hypothetical protein [Riemerella anatipestifer]WCS66390.1 hypothetical protein CRP5_000035 [Riemerella phage vB_RanS_CRP5]WIL01300.1 hypothetical protein CRP6_000020 [Riemerella phage vB_RanS_CRP6]MDR7750140.1 hypothetical protein [Riemerella anatipestifer]MDR7752374.1 hypothetical protein [Riemerella anatipestifer]MDR7754370.1 hypothetical protein [Riemerella anatipestifer]